MRRLAILGLIVGSLSACQYQPKAGTRTAQEEAMFAPVSMRLHPIFTRVQDWTGDGKPDGIEALLEFQDQFLDPTKAMGTVVFELYSYRRGFPDPRGQRLVEPWVGSLDTLQSQREHWNRTSRTYSFELAWAGIDPHKDYVLTAVFQKKGGGRFFDQMVIEGKGREKGAEAGGGAGAGTSTEESGSENAN